LSLHLHLQAAVVTLPDNTCKLLARTSTIQREKNGSSNIYQHRFTESVLRPHVPPAVTFNNNQPGRVKSDYFSGQYLKNGHPVVMKIYTAKCEGRQSRLSFMS